MHRHCQLLAILTLLGATGANVTACSSTDDSAPSGPQGLGGNAATAGGGTSAPPSSGVSVGGTTATASGGASGVGISAVNGANAGGTSSSGGSATAIDSTSTGGVKAAGGASASSSIGGNAAGGVTSTSSAYACNLIFGNSTTQQWFDGGFLTYPQIDPTRWELIAVAHHYIDSWANANDVGWTTAFDLGHQCANRATTPDRVIFIVTYSPPYPDQATYVKYITSIVNNIKTRYPTVKRIELTTLVRAPGNSATACSSKANNEQSMPAAEDQAIAAVAAAPAFAGLVTALPPFYVTNCSDFTADAPQYTTTGAANIAKVYGAYYAAHL